METHTFFLYLLTILLTARLMAEIAVRLSFPSVIGELMAGIILGPSLFGWLEPNDVLKLLAEIGIILLLFEVGCETDVRRLASTSIGITIRVLSDLKRQQDKEGQIVLGAAVLDDILGVVLLALLYEFSVGGGVSLVNVSKVLIFVGAFFILAPFAAKFMSMLISRYESSSEIPGLIPTTIVSLVLFFAWLAHVIGAPELLGGFAAGLALSRRFFLPFGIALHTNEEFAQRIKIQMRPIIHLFTPIFFVMVGLSLNLHEIDWSSPFIWSFSLLFFTIAVLGKFAGTLFIKESWKMRLMIGLAMVPRGEVGLIFAELGRVTNIFNNEIYAGMVIVIALTTILPPIIMKWSYKKYSHLK